MKKSKIAKIIWFLFILMLVIGIGCLFFLPTLYDLFKDKGVEPFGSHTLIYRLAFFFCYIICLVIVYKLINLFKMVYEGTPFKKELENILKVIAVLFMILFITIIIKAIFIPTLLSFAVAIVCFMVSLCFYVLAEVIKAAISYKKELDLTV